MPRNVSISPEDMAWLRQNHTRHPFTHLARRTGCCVDTLKRILVREGLQDFPGAKYQPARPRTRTWQRPCMNCKDTLPRPVGLYLCNRCRNLEDPDE